MHPLICESGEYTIKHCNTAVEPYDPAVCDGTYTELSCADGGNLKECFGETKPLIQIYCNGTYSDGNCEGFVPPTFSIIQVNNSHWLQGVCSNHILNNACEGLFNEAQFMKCSGDPLNNKEDFDACTPIDGEAFGTCDGVTNSSGCFGTYEHPVEIDGRTFHSKCRDDAEDRSYNFEKYSCKVDFKAADGDSEIDVSCDEGFDPKRRRCPNGQGLILIRHAEKERPGIMLRRKFACHDAALNFKDFSCSSAFENSACYGKAIAKADGTVTCLGNFIKNDCPTGGSQNGCKGKSEKNIELTCFKSYFDGFECTSDKFSHSTEIVIHEKGFSLKNDQYDRPVKIAEFEVDGFTMVNAESTSADLEHSVIKLMNFKNAEQRPDGSLEKIKVLENTKTPISFDEGQLRSIVFKNFMLDDLDYHKFATDDSCRLVHIKFSELTIKNVLFQNFVCKNTVIRSLTWAESSTPDFGADEVATDIGFGVVILRDVEVYLPYISKSTIMNWKKSAVGSKEVSIVIPKINEIEVPEYKIHFTADETDIFLEFPTFKIEDRSIDLIYMADYVLDSTELIGKPEIVSQVLEGYSEDPRLSSLELESTNSHEEESSESEN